MQDYRKLTRVAESACSRARTATRFLTTSRSPDAWPLRDQLLRAAISIPSNIAEGAGRGSGRGFPAVSFPLVGIL